MLFSSPIQGEMIFGRFARNAEHLKICGGFATKMAVVN